MLRQQLDLPAVVQELQKTLNPSCDIRRRLLALMNCLYETEKKSLFTCIALTPRKLLEDNVVLSSASYSRSNRLTHIDLPFTYLILYPTDCLSIAYFVRLASEQMQNSESILLNLSYCFIGAPEIKTLSLELCKQAPKKKCLP